MISISAAGATDVGRVRAVNEDSLLIEEGIVAVADGMGGHSGGDVASRLALERLHSGYDEPTTGALLQAVQTANEGVIEVGSDDPSLSGMGTTLVVLAVVGPEGGDHLAVANVGDSRCYLLAGDRLEQITTDHTVVQTLVDHGEITPADAAIHPHRNVITRALGIDQRVMTDYWDLKPAVGDRYLLRSDGLTGEISDGEMEAVLNDVADLHEAARTLVDRAVDAGGRDNVTVVVADVAATDVAAAPADDRVLMTVGGSAQAIADGTLLGSTSPGGGDRDGSVDDDDEPAPRRRPGYRALLVGFVLGAVALAILGAVVFAGRGTYFVAFDQSEVVVYKGRPGGVLWLDPSVDSRTGLFRGEVPSVFLDELDAAEEFGSRDEAEEYVARIRLEVASLATGIPPPTATPPDDTGDVDDDDGSDGGEEEPEGTTTTDRVGHGLVS